MISYIKRTKWKKIKKLYQREMETYRFDDEKDCVIVTQYYHRERLNPEDARDSVCDSLTTTNI